MRKVVQKNPWKVAFILVVMLLFGIVSYTGIALKEFKFPNVASIQTTNEAGNNEIIEMKISRNLVNQIVAQHQLNQDIAIQWVEDNIIIQANMPFDLVKIPVEIYADMGITPNGSAALTLTEMKIVGYKISLTSVYDWLQGALENQSWVNFELDSPTMVVDPNVLLNTDNQHIKLKSIDYENGQLLLELEKNVEDILNII